MEAEAEEGATRTVRLPGTRTRYLFGGAEVDMRQGSN